MITPQDARPDVLTSERYRLTLFVNGASDLSARAIDAVTRMCDAHLSGRCRLEVVDVHDQPEAAVRSCVRVVPTLVRTSPLPVRRLAGELSQERVLAMLRELGDAETATP